MFVATGEAGGCNHPPHTHPEGVQHTCAGEVIKYNQHSKELNSCFKYYSMRVNDASVHFFSIAKRNEPKKVPVKKIALLHKTTRAAVF